MDSPNIYSWYESNIGPITPLMADALKDAEQDYPREWIIEAFKEALAHNVRNWAYVSKILETWRAHGYKRSGKNSVVVDYTALVPEYDEAVAADDELHPAPEFCSLWRLIWTDMARPIKVNYPMAPVRRDGDTVIVAVEDERALAWARSRMQALLERAFMADVRFEVGSHV